MNTRSLLNIFLLFFIITLLSFILWNNEDLSYLKLKLTNLDKNEINTITIPRSKGDIILQLSSTGWMMQTPYTAPAHDFRVNQLLNLTQIIAENSYSIDKLDLTQFNLAPSDTTIIFNDTTLEFGKTNPVNLLRYIKSGDKLFLVRENIYPLLRSQPSSFISLSLLPESSQIKSISLPELTLIKDSTTKWTLSPEQEITQDQIQTIIGNWKNAKAFAVHAYIERKNLGQVKLQLDSKLIVFEITDNDPWLILARKDLGIEYHLDKSQNDILLNFKATETQQNN